MMIGEIIVAFLNAIIEGCAIDAADLEMHLNNGMIDHLYNVLALFAFELTIIYFLLEINKKYMFEGNDVTFKTFFAPFAKLALAIALISKLGLIKNLLVSGHNELINYMAFWGERDGLSAIEPLADDSVSIGLIKGMLFLISLLPFWLVSQVVKVIWWYKTISYKIEFMFRIGVTPIAMADSYNGMSSTSIRWLKGCLGFTIYGVAFMILPHLAFSIATSYFITPEAYPNLFENANANPALRDAMPTLDLSNADGLFRMVKFVCMMFVGPIAALGSLSAVRQVIKEAVG